ncbi:hypothetical protein AUC68_02940 [Methyloceanibacter methanicus]|uniref:Uncharacterized protein n=1 Tax=Methyloceanibacter methanicus TaxID=1774968 RepID=A0A1E3W2T3_9HYPH|nr:hypothetical protein [Methyloceanibacter methanicus]ODS00091.1 hypothetical protein AUC68_02940 [Methyloceanibacter methanicus]
MKIISDKMHAVLDYVTVAIFALAPTVIGLAGLPAMISYVLAAVHLAMTVVTDMPFSLVKLIPIKLHELVEAVVGPVLVVGALVLPWPLSARIFFGVMGAIIFVVWLLSSYGLSRGRPVRIVDRP